MYKKFYFVTQFKKKKNKTVESTHHTMHISHTCLNITGTASMDPKSNGKVSAVCFLYIMITNTMPTVIGSILVVAIKPGTRQFTSQTRFHHSWLTLWINRYFQGPLFSFSGQGVANSKSQFNLTTNLETPDIFADLLRYASRHLLRYAARMYASLFPVLRSLGG